MALKSFTVRSDNHPDCTLYADDEADAAIKYCRTYGTDDEVTVESDDYYVTFDVNFIGMEAFAAELDREQK